MSLSGNKNCFTVKCQWCPSTGSGCDVNENVLNFKKILSNAWPLVMYPLRFRYKKFSAYKFTITPLLMLFLVMCLTLAIDSVNAHARHSSNVYLPGHPSQEFSRHYIIKPQIYHGRHKRLIPNTLEEEGLHATHITLSYDHNGRSIIADLELNENLIPQGHFLRYQKANGGSVIQNLTKTDINLCHYQGTLRDTVGSHIAVSTCNGINGLVYDGAETYYIYSGPEGQIHDNHFIFRNSDMLLNGTCGYENNHSPINNNMFRFKRSNVEDVIRGPYNANKHSSFVELVIVVDNKVYKSFGENLKKVHNHCKDIANIVNALYVPLNIFIALVGVVVWNESNEIELSSDGDDTLKKFLHYRRNSLVQNHPNDNAQLLTKEQFEGGVVGKALKGPICTYEYSGGVSMEHSQIVAVVATTVAHEMGHNFGMEHDTSDCKCVDEKCIMSASSTSVVPRHWSSCSIDQLNVAFSHGMNYCLRNKPIKLFESPQCGNGFVELGEQCDCGLPEFCENSCCDPNTCMLNANASCATGECCDLMTCRPKNPGTECRSAEEECDLPEYCTGESEYCPSDVYKRDTEECDNGHAYCYKGACRSRSNQCKILWGPSGESSEHCYGKNTDGSRHGNCGYDRLTNQYLQCAEVDVHCGMLHCKHLNERLEFGMESVAILSHSFMNHEGTIIPCRTVIVDLGLQSPDPGLTPNGAKCGDGKMCVNQKCVTIDILRSRGLGIKCPNNCNGQGICNSAGNCHCYLGFSPPDCTNPGQGGSVNSGPATNPNSRIGFTRAMYIFFLGVVPFIAIILLLSYYWRQNHPLQFRQSPNVTKLSIKSGPSPPGPPTSSPSSTDDMNSALLKSPTDTDTSNMNNTMFGKFKGFTLKPLPCATNAMNIGGPNVAFVHPVTKSFEGSRQLNGVPFRSAPPVPKPPSVCEKNDSDKGTMKKSAPVNINETTSAPALPPPNPGFNARPIISNPVLETSTCTARELISPLKQTSGNGTLPIRVASLSPSIPLIQPNREFNVQFIKPKDGGTIKRIASFLKKEDDSNSLPKHPPKVKPTIDREKLKNIKISAPIPVVDTEVTSSDELKDHQFVARSQSMRNPSSLKTKMQVQSFGSMRQPSISNRPKSLIGVRPKSPPPRPPAPSAIATSSAAAVAEAHTTLAGVNQNGQNSLNHEYDDCEAVETPLTNISEENSANGSDNIYSVIDENPPPSARNNTVLSPPPISGSNDSMGLLGEIVNEIEKLNVDSIYSASTLKKKKTPSDNTQYGHASETSDYSDSDYLKSSSTTSSGYLRPSAINAPVARVAPTRPNPVGSKSFTSFKPNNSGSKYNGPVRVIRSETPANSSVQNKSNVDFVRKRSPSPSSSSKNSTASTAASRGKLVDLKKATKMPEASSVSSTLSKKPKTLSKPIISSKLNVVSNNSGISEKRVKIAAENSSSDSKLLGNANRSKSINNDRSLPNYKSSSVSKSDDR